MKIVLEREQPISLNEFYSGMHWRERKAEADRVHMLVKYMLGRKYSLLTGKVNIFITCYFQKRMYDSDNIVAKLYIDGMKGVLLKDDTPEYVGFVATKSEKDAKNPRLEILLEAC